LLSIARISIEDEGQEVFAVSCDVSDRDRVDRVDRLIATVRARYGRIDILVNNAGEIRVAPLENTSIENFEQAMGVMFWGVVYPTLAVLPEMRQRGSGRIATITSVGGKVSVPHLLAYSCAKFAAVGFCEGLRAEAARNGVRVTTIVPGLMRTRGHRNAVFGGKSQSEAGWFGVGASLPLLAMNAERAARKIVDATRRSKAERILTPQAHLLSTLHGISPGLVTNVLTRVNRLLPWPSGDHQTMRGAEAEEQMPGWWRAATTFGRRAAAHLNQ
jgi:NAD(P)-dependent dehydrogenase (short-subunit alcohol dehydrogenase family)